MNQSELAGAEVAEKYYFATSKLALFVAIAAIFALELGSSDMGLAIGLACAVFVVEAIVRIVISVGWKATKQAAIDIAGFLLVMSILLGFVSLVAGLV